MTSRADATKHSQRNLGGTIVQSDFSLYRQPLRADNNPKRQLGITCCATSCQSDSLRHDARCHDPPYYHALHQVEQMTQALQDRERNPEAPEVGHRTSFPRPRRPCSPPISFLPSLPPVPGRDISPGHCLEHSTRGPAEAVQTA